MGRARAAARALPPQVLAPREPHNLKPETRIMKPEPRTRSSKPETRDPEPGTWNQKALLPQVLAPREQPIFVLPYYPRASRVIRNYLLLGPYSRPLPRALGRS